jgi:hypothetical protein
MASNLEDRLSRDVASHWEIATPTRRKAPTT